MALCTFAQRHRKLAVSVLIVLAMWGISVLHQTRSICSAPGPTTVAIVQTPSYPVADATLEAMVQDAVAKAGGLDSVISPGDVVVVKPNLVETMFQSGSGIVTDKRVVRAVVRMAQQLTGPTGQVIIAEGTARYRDAEYVDLDCTRKAFKDSGLDTDGDMIDDETGAQMYDLNRTSSLSNHISNVDVADPNYVTLVDMTSGLLEREFYVPNILLTCDVLISVPILKNHSLGTITGGMKNRVGCAPNDLYHMPNDYRFKHGLVHINPSTYPDEADSVNAAVVDLNMVRPADFTVMDGLIGITNGPTGTNKPSPYVRCVMAGRDAVAVDMIESLVMAIDPDCVKHLMHSRDLQFGQTDTSLIRVVGKTVAEIRNEGPSRFPVGYGGAVRCDLTPPQADGMYPPNGGIVSGVVPVGVTNPSDTGGSQLAKAELYVDGDFYAEDRTTDYEFLWDSSGYDSGTHTLTVKVYDKDLNELVLTSIVTLEAGWTIPITGTAGSLSDTFTFGIKNGASDGADAYDVIESTTSPFLSLATLMGSTYYSEDYKAKMTSPSEVREWSVYIASDVNPAPSPVTLDWSSVDWTLIPPTFELQLVDYGTSWASPQKVYDMRDTNSISFDVSITGLPRYVKLRAINSAISSIANYKYMPNGTTVQLAGKIVTAGNDQLMNTFYISDPDGTSGIRVSHGTGGAPTVSVGDMVDVTGTIMTYYGERVILYPSVTKTSSGNPVPSPRSMPNKSVGGDSLGQYIAAVPGSSGPNNVGLLIRTWGRVTYSDGVATFYVDDGSNRNDGLGNLGIRVNCSGRVSGSTLTLPAQGDYVTITGVSAALTSGGNLISIIRPRDQADIVVR